MDFGSYRIFLKYSVVLNANIKYIYKYTQKLVIQDEHKAN